MATKLTLIIFAALLTSCQSSKRSTCSSIDWRTNGEIAALKGQKEKDILNAHKDTCNDYEFVIDDTAFSEGFERGLAQFCTTGNGFDFGELGEDYLFTCKKNQENLFLKGFYKGKIEYLQKEFENTSTLYAEAEDRLWRKEREFLIIQNEDPEQAKLEIDVIESYREEARLLAQKKRATKKQINRIKKLSLESLF